MDKICLRLSIVFICVILHQNRVFGFGQFCEESGIEFKKGETITVPGECVSFTCEEPGINLMVGKKCDSKPRKGCKFETGDDSKPFPECCPKEIC
mgnify:CR=1 FL=1